MSERTIAYIIAAVIVGHFIFGFGWLIYKLNFKPKDKSNQKDSSKDQK